MTNYRMDAEEEALFRSYPYALYFVQSPSTASRANSSPIRSENFNINNPTINTSQEVRRFTLSHYSSSRGSNNSSFLQEKKIIAYDLQSHGTAAGTENGENRLIRISDDHDHGVDHDEDYDDDEEEEEDYKKSGWWRYLSFRGSSSVGWICLQISWRVILSLAVALLVFYIATKPPPPKISIKMAGIGQFGLGEGVDGSGVTTKILTCNCSMNLVIDNKSKLFGLHINPPLMELSFAKLPFAISYGPKLYAYNDGLTMFKLYVGTRNKPMYGAGRTMQDMLESGEGLPLKIRVSLRSNFRVVWNLIKPKFKHQAECSLVLHSSYGKKHSRNQAFNSSCVINA
ncbi:uncharacterized protein LOC132298640 [Cornus florida]|uniref:uncharacterized protein LOC132298640 n=1 Tax=Cornus florida TaxID=4283 RepID=UPI0028A2A0F5|nr:uncharacterized protein LOC132298640 [Cornus florida]